MQIKMLKQWNAFQKDSIADPGKGVAVELIRRGFAIEVKEKVTKKRGRPCNTK